METPSLWSLKKIKTNYLLKQKLSLFFRKKLLSKTVASIALRRLARLKAFESFFNVETVRLPKGFESKSV